MTIVAIEPLALLHSHHDVGVETEIFNHGAGRLTPGDYTAGWSEIELFSRAQIAPLDAPIVDQDGNQVGIENRQANDFLTVQGYRDADGTIWTPPTAYAYAAVCAARHQWQETAEQARKHLAALVDAVAGNDPEELLAALQGAQDHLNKERAA